MSAPLLKRPSIGLRKFRPLVAAASLAYAVAVTGTAAAEEEEPNTVAPQPFSTLRCSCQQTALPDGPAATEAIRRGLQQGGSAWLPGLPAPESRP